MTDGLRIAFTLVVMAVGFRFKAGLVPAVRAVLLATPSAGYLARSDERLTFALPVGNRSGCSTALHRLLSWSFWQSSHRPQLNGARPHWP
jgi:hypothetical protein